MKFIFYLFFLKAHFCSCNYEQKYSEFDKTTKAYRAEKMGDLPEWLTESSGVVKIKDENDAFWMIDDNENGTVYKINASGKVLDKLEYPIKVVDKEEITSDDNGNLYIGDIGNNANNRKDLCIYKSNITSKKIDKINISYANQKAFPPIDKNDKNFDCEAFFYHQDSLYLFSKNRGHHWVQLYSTPTQSGNYILQPKDSILIKTMVTGAAINPSKTEFALLTYGKVVVFDIINQQISFAHPKYCIKFARKQSEAITYINETDFLITNEQGEIFLLKKKDKNISKD